jgi:hypothetical protein
VNAEKTPLSDDICENLAHSVKVVEKGFNRREEARREGKRRT